MNAIAHFYLCAFIDQKGRTQYWNCFELGINYFLSSEIITPLQALIPVNYCSFLSHISLSSHNLDKEPNDNDLSPF